MSKEKSAYFTSSGAPAEVETPRAVEEEVGAAVKAIRLRRGLTTGEVANAAGLSVGMLSKVENGLSSPSLATLSKLASALAVPMSQFFRDFEERKDCSFVPSGQGVNIKRQGTKAKHAYQLLGAAVAGDVAVEPYLIELEKGANPYTSFKHAGTEFIYLLDGRIDYRHGDSVYAMAPGDSLLFDSAAPHGPEVLHELPAKFLSVIVYQRPT